MPLSLKFDSCGLDVKQKKRGGNQNPRGNVRLKPGRYMETQKPGKALHVETNKPLVQRRLEYWLKSDDFQDDVDKTDIISAIKTDHAAIVLQVNSVEKQPTGPSYWKFNFSLL